jgi:hypothetical protein
VELLNKALLLLQDYSVRLLRLSMLVQKTLPQ